MALDVSGDVFCSARHVGTETIMWFRYMDDSFVVWPHGLGSLQEFFVHIVSLRPTIEFTLEVEMVQFCDIPVLCRLQCRNSVEDRHKHNKYLIV